jgi:hypothetical protein
VDKESDIGTPCAHRNRHGNSVPIPDGVSTKPPSEMSAHFVEEGLHRENIENRRTCEVRSEKMRPQKPRCQISTDRSSVHV